MTTSFSSNRAYILDYVGWCVRLNAKVDGVDVSVLVETIESEKGTRFVVARESTHPQIGAGGSLVRIPLSLLTDPNLSPLGLRQDETALYWMLRDGLREVFFKRRIRHRAERSEQNLESRGTAPVVRMPEPLARHGYDHDLSPAPRSTYRRKPR